MQAAQQRPSLWVAYLCLASSMSLVGSYVGLSKWLLLVFPVPLLALLRFGLAAVIMWPWTPRTPGYPPLTPHHKRLLFLESFLGNFLFSVFMLYGMAMSSAVTAGVIMAGIPAAVALLSWLLLGEHVRRRVMLGIALTFAGLAWVSVHGQSGHASAGAPPSLPGISAATAQWLGPLLLVLAVLCEASYVVIGKQLSAHISPKNISAWVNVWGLLLMAPMGLWVAWSFDWSTVPLSAWPTLGFYALAASMVTVWLWMTGLRRVPASRAGVFTVMLPLTAAAVGIVFLGEAFSVHQAVAFALALAGLMLATWPDRADASPNPAPPQAPGP